MELIEQLEQTRDEKRAEFRAIEQARGERKWALESEVTTTLEREYGEQMRAAQSAVYNAEKALKAEHDRIAIEAAKPPYPVGTKVERWVYPTNRWSGRRESETPERTGEIGRIEIVTAETTFPDNMADYSRPRVGSVIVRLAKKDGTASKKFAEDRYHSGWKMWRPIEVDLNEELNADKLRAEREAREAAETAERQRQEALSNAAAEVFGL